MSSLKGRRVPTGSSDDFFRVTAVKSSLLAKPARASTARFEVLATENRKYYNNCVKMQIK
jgi:hypothetical protein